MKVTATAKWKDKETGEEQVRTEEVEYDFGDTIHQLMEEIGEEAVFHHAKSAMIVSLQSAVRSWVLQGLTKEEIDVKLNEWSVPTGKPRGKSRMDKMREMLGKMSAEDREQLLSSLD